MNGFYLVFDFTDCSLFSSLTFMPLWIAIGGIAVWYVSIRFVNPESTDLLGRNRRRSGRFWGIVLASFAGIFFVANLILTINSYFETKAVFESNQFQTVEGRVTNYHPMPETGHDNETFEVNGIHFEFSDFDVGYFGYNNAASHGGAIRKDRYVRIGYYNNGTKNVILRLELR